MRNLLHRNLIKLISAPIVAAARSQQELTSVYIDNLMRLAYSDKADVDFNIEAQTSETTQEPTKDRPE